MYVYNFCNEFMSYFIVINMKLSAVDPACEECEILQWNVMKSNSFQFFYMNGGHKKKKQPDTHI